MKENNLQLYLPLAASVAHFMWYPPKVCSSGSVGFAGRCLEHFHGLAYQSKISLSTCYSYMEDVLLDCLTIGSAFSACGGRGRLVHEGNLCLPLCGWTSMSCNSQLAWCQMLVALAFVCNQMDNDEYELVAPLVPRLTSKRLVPIPVVIPSPIFLQTALLPQVPPARFQPIGPVLLAPDVALPNSQPIKPCLLILSL
ncbi:hypothetical protein DSO57_1033997 [Entomophthora muscae]|uniref:Uncharacterized protein n=1 Tax=Entomophthora muscae TaxID=34485 RepID=A0ACC2U9S2_9FUNG|nr:hypothetical protein DSO57_1033997 [Entomophthora muscae]